MNKKRNIAMASAALAVIIVVSAVTSAALMRQNSSSGKYYRDVADRVRFCAEGTEFSFTRVSSGSYEIDFSFSAEKTEADFYAVIKSADVEGVSYESLIFKNTSSSEVFSPENIALPAENGKTKEVSWDIAMIVPAPALTSDTQFYLVVSYVSGMTPDTADEHTLRIPMKIVFD